MARPKPNFPEIDEIRALADGEARLAVRVTPGARSEGLSIERGLVHVKVRAKPQDGAANEAVARLLSKALGCPRSSVSLLRGATSRNKLFRLDV